MNVKAEIPEIMPEEIRDQEGGLAPVLPSYTSHSMNICVHFNGTPHLRICNFDRKYF